MEENNRGFVNKFNSFNLWFTKFIRSSRVQNVVALVMLLFIIEMYYRLIGMILSDVNPDPEVAYYYRQGFYFHTFSTLGYTALFLSVNFYRITRTPDLDVKILKFTQKFYSEETAKLCFEPLLADWKKEHLEAVLQNKNWKAYRISIRYACAFLSAMLMQSRIGRLLQTIFKS